MLALQIFLLSFLSLCLVRTLPRKSHLLRIVHSGEAAAVAARDGNPILFTDSRSRESPAKEYQIFESLTQSVRLSASSAHSTGGPRDSFVRSQLRGS